MGNFSELETFRRALAEKNLERAWGSFRLLQAAGRDGLLEGGDLAAFAGLLKEANQALDAARLFLQAAEKSPGDATAPPWLMEAATLLLGPADRPEWGEKIRQRLLECYPQSAQAAQAAAWREGTPEIQPAGRAEPVPQKPGPPRLGGATGPAAGAAGAEVAPLRPLVPRWALGVLAALAGLWLLGRIFSERLSGAGEIDHRLLAEPEQAEIVDGETVRLEVEEFWLTLYPRFSYRICGLVVSVNDYAKLGLRFQDFYHRDFCLIWGDNVSSGVFRHRDVDFEHHGNVCYYQCRSALCPSGRLLANTHLLSAERDILKQIDRVRRSDQVCLRGKLVDVAVKQKQAPACQMPGSARLATSTTREDKGMGACEIMLVEEVELVAEGNRFWRVLSAIGFWGLALLLAFLICRTLAQRLRRPSGRATVMLLLAACCWARLEPARAGDEESATPPGPITVLITHPTAGELENLARLVERKLLDVPGLRLVGVYHRDEWEDYRQSRQYLRSRQWTELRRLDCELAQEDVFRPNACTPHFEALFGESAGVVFTGGPDIPPALYGEKTALTTEIEDPHRHYFEISFLFHLIGSSRNPAFSPLLGKRPDYAVIGLCLGLQSMNVAAGGTLVQDIPTEVYGIKTLEDGLKLDEEKIHRSFQAPLYPAPDIGRGVVHSIKPHGRSVLRSILFPDGEPVRVLSLHHQAVEKLGRDLEPLATSLDGRVVEALWHRRFPAVLGVQFHPEKALLWERDRGYRRDRRAEANNFVADWFLSDRRAQAFTTAFWKLVGQLLKKSAGH